ncbi:hypothetical protein J1614_001976 [Plenodomus biglobosus]|nr:hypothetical protein J1614_001976 [Plenodomus biglobosus]
MALWIAECNWASSYTQSGRFSLKRCPWSHTFRSVGTWNLRLLLIQQQHTIYNVILESFSGSKEKLGSGWLDFETEHAVASRDLAESLLYLIWTDHLQLC